MNLEKLRITIFGVGKQIKGKKNKRKGAEVVPENSKNSKMGSSNIK